MGRNEKFEINDTYFSLLVFPASSTGKEDYLQCRRFQFYFWIGNIHWRRDRLPTLVFWCFSGGSAGKESACKAGDLGCIPGLGRSPGKGKGYPVQHSALENSMNSIVHGVAESDMTERLSHFFCSVPGKIKLTGWFQFKSS